MILIATKLAFGDGRLLVLQLVSLAALLLGFLTALSVVLEQLETPDEETTYKLPSTPERHRDGSLHVFPAETDSSRMAR